MGQPYQDRIPHYRPTEKSSGAGYNYGFPLSDGAAKLLFSGDYFNYLNQ
jgi:hypothetical protein